MVKQGKSVTSFFEEDHSANVRKIVEDYVKVGAVTDKNAPRGMVLRKASWKNKK